MFLTVVAAVQLRGTTKFERRRCLPVFSPSARPDTPIPIPGDRNVLTYTLPKSQVDFARSVRRMGSFVHVLSGDIGCVVDVAMAHVADDESSAAVKGVCRGRCRLGPFVNGGVYVEPVGPDELTDDDPLLDFALDDMELDDARDLCASTLSEVLFLAQLVDPNLGAIDNFGDPKPGVFEDMRSRLADALNEDTEDKISFALLALAGGPAELTASCVASTSAARRYSALVSFLSDVRDDLATLQALADISDTYKPPPPRPCSSNVPVCLALLQKGRRIAYWWGRGEDNWVTATVRGMDKDGNYVVNFDVKGYSKRDKVPLPLATVDKDRWFLLPPDYDE